MSLDFWLFGNEPIEAPRLSFGEVMDRLFELWCGDGTDKTFEEFCDAR